MPNARRVEKIRILIREVLAEIISRDVQFPDGTLVTVTRVEPSDDLYYAGVFVSVFSQEKDAEKEALEQLTRKTKSVQYALNRKLRMRPVPKIRFAIDLDEKRRERIEKLLSEHSEE